MKKSKKWITFSVCATTLSLFLATNNFADETQTTSTTNSSTMAVSSSSSTPVAEYTETSAMSTETTTTTTTESSSANNAEEVAAQTAAQEVKPIEGTIKNVNQENGTYDVVVKVNAEIKPGIKEVKVPIWQRADQKDLKWYQAEKQNDGTWLVHMNIANHQYHRGVYTTHVYVYANDGSYEAVNLGETSIKNIATQLSANIINIDAEKGSFDVVVNGVSGSGIHHVKVPIWSTPNQSDLKWYDAVKQADGSYIAHMDIKNHQYHTGKYTVHVYMYNNDRTGLAKNIGQVSIKGTNDVLDAKVQNVNINSGSYDVVVKASSMSGIRKVQVPIWSAKNQNDLKWYDAVKQDNGTYIVHMNIKNHKYHRGEYTTHVYMTANDGHQYAKNIGTTQLPDINNQLKAEVANVNDEKGTFDVVVHGKIDSGIKKIQVPIWSTANQSDLKWYDAVKQADGSYTAHMDIKNHQYHRGEYTTHVYMTANSGRQMAINIGKTKLTDAYNRLTASVVNVNEKQGSYDVVVKGQIDSGIKKIQVPIWSTANQSDLKWYDAAKQADGSYIAHMNIKNHKYHRGVYTTHVYMTANSGRQIAINIGKTNLKDVYELNATIKNVDEVKGSYDVVVKGQIDSRIKKIQVPIWSAANQNDLKWYDAVKQADGSYLVHMNIKNHKYHRGVYTTHVYMTANSGRQVAKNIGTTNLSDKYTHLEGKIININNARGTYDVEVKGRIDSGIKKVRVPIWSAADQSDIKWYDAVKQSDGSYIAHMDFTNHKFHVGIYKTHVYMYSNAGTQKAIALQDTKLNATEVNDGLSAEIANVNQGKGTFDVYVYTRSTSGVKSVKVPVWHTANQSDLVWYTASKVGSNVYKATISVKNHHFNNGKYTVHAYMTNNKNKEFSINVGTTNLSGVYNRIEMTNVPWISQYKPVFAPWGCASAAMAMLIESRGIHVDLKDAQDTLPMYPANKDGQLGNVYTGEGFGFVIKPSGLVRHAHKWTNAVYNISGSSTQQIIDTVLNGQPVLYYGFSGYQVDNVRNHCKVIVGYKDGKFKVHDPLYMRASDGPGSRGTNKTYSRGAIHWITIAQFNQEYQGNAITIK